LYAGSGKSFETVIASAIRIADDKIRIISIQQGVPGDINKLAWLRSPASVGRSSCMKDGNDKYRVVSAQSEDGRKIYAKDGLMYLPPPGHKPDEITGELDTQRQEISGV